MARDLRDRGRVLGAVPARGPRPGIRLRPGSFAGQGRPEYPASARDAPRHRANGVRCLIEIHGGTIFVSASLAHRLLSRFDPKDIGVIYDPQNMVADGYETTPLAPDLLGEYLAHLHVGGHKAVPGTPDANGTVPWTYPGCRLYEGRYNYNYNYNYPQLLTELHRRRYQGFVSIEDFDGTRAPEQRLQDAIAYLRRIEPKG